MLICFNMLIEEEELRQ